jgi:8-oxo-dGTP pyrophosphatase MutT (NUDIX family)
MVAGRSTESLDSTDMTMATSIKGVFLVEGGVVLVKNPRNEWEASRWTHRTGESPEATLAREFDEELSVQVQVGAPIDSYVLCGHTHAARSHRHLRLHACRAPSPPRISRRTLGVIACALSNAWAG